MSGESWRKYRERFNRVFVVLSVVWIAYAVTLPRKWAMSAEQDEIQEVEAALPQCSMYPNMDQNWEACMDKRAQLAMQAERTVRKKYTNAWKRVFPGAPVWGALALFLLPPVAAYGLLVGAVRIVMWVWLGRWRIASTLF